MNTIFGPNSGAGFGARTLSSVGTGPTGNLHFKFNSASLLPSLLFLQNVGTEISRPSLVRILLLGVRLLGIRSVGFFLTSRNLTGRRPEGLLSAHFC